ncbi:MAG: GDSL family lipase [Pirellulales bacterium]|nr:GDSL family lipase [Pirellulales bacterium]
MKMHLGAFTLFLAAVLLVPSVTSGKEEQKLHSAIKPVPFGGGHLRRHRAANKRLQQGNVDMLMLGNSITDSWDGKGKPVWDEYYAGRKAVNLGRSGARTQHVLWQVDNLAVENISPKLVVLLIGTNNTKDNTSEQIAEGVTRIVQKLRKRLPRTKILLLAIFPNGPNDDDPRRQVARKASQLYSKLSEDEMVVYMDLRDRFVKPDGTPTECLRPDDLLHLSLAGYRAWAEAIEPVVAEVVGPKLAR